MIDFQALKERNRNHNIQILIDAILILKGLGFKKEAKILRETLDRYKEMK